MTWTIRGGNQEEQQPCRTMESLPTFPELASLHVFAHDVQTLGASEPVGFLSKPCDGLLRFKICHDTAGLGVSLLK